MEQHYKKFVTTFYQFLTDYNRYIPSDETSNILKIYNNLDMAKVIFKIYYLLKNNSAKINSNDESLFQTPFILLPGIDLSTNWNTLTKGQKDKLWIFMKIMSLETDILMNPPTHTTQTLSDPSSTMCTTSSTMSTTTSTPTSQLVVATPEFNPYVGVGTTNPSEYGVNEMFANLPEEDEQSGPGLSMIASMCGLDKMINMDELSQQLQNMKPEDITDATNNIKSMLGSNIDTNTSNLIEEMLTTITSELSNNKGNGGDPLKSIFNIAEKVANKVKPSAENNNIDISQLLNSTKSFANQCKDKNGNPMFTEQNNPFNLLDKLTKSMSAPNGLGNEGDYMKQCNDMLKNMGMSNIDLNNPNINQMMSQLQQNKQPGQNQSNQSNKSKNGKKKKNNKKNQ